ncbi:PLP-dependent aminotransferase family protein [Paracoccus homiensis]|uniref:DNA-binding transcriptional regulator, MocR family, contains an aminotransferase domain n=1 Tax=Paracoccus homiensis TaxID=364199 RepID=A0A1I0EFE1_9RHOB|nr:PLP-dependent aminotransferase family protein [Paracoccus homiensis]SET43157.1 DNA-binding transcriptional regulator, MocR family, contains an aminotransferase domain [Paracoccus homiensis]
MSHWPLRKEDITRPAYRSLAQGIAAAIDSGSLRPGDRLPPHRDLAWRLHLSVQTVSRAYEELIRADLISGEVGRGSFVKSGPRETVELPWFRAATERPPIDLSMMTPVALPQVTQAWSDSLQRIATRLPHSAMHSFRPRQAMALYGGMAAGWLARCGMVVPAQRIIITNGNTPAFMVALMTAAQPGEEIAVESYSCHALKPAIRHLHLRMRGIDCDDRGMIPQALAQAARMAGGKLRAVFLLPSGAGPQARIIDRERREDLAQTAAEHGLIIIENDALGPVAPRRPPPVSSFAPERSLYFTGLSKCLSPGLRLGFLALPETLAERAMNRHLSVAWMATPMVAEIANDWITSGVADDLLVAQRQELAARNRMAQRILGPLSAGFGHGLHRWIALPNDVDDHDLLQAALDRNVAVTASTGFSVSDRSPALRLCLGGPTRGDLEQALTTIAGILGN